MNSKTISHHIDNRAIVIKFAPPHIATFLLAIFIHAGCAPNNYSFATSHSLASTGASEQANLIGIGYDGLPRKTFSRTYQTTSSSSYDSTPRSYTEEIRSGTGLYFHGITSAPIQTGSLFTRIVLPLYIGEMPSVSAGYLYKDVSIQGVVRSSIANNGIGAGVSYNPFRDLYMAIGYEHRVEFKGGPKRGEFIYTGIFNKPTDDVERPTLQADYKIQIPKANIIATLGCIFALSEQYDIQFSASLNHF